MEGLQTRIKKADNGKLLVPDQVIIPYIEGDGIGPDIWKASVRVFDAAIRKAYAGKRHVFWKEVLAGEKAFTQTGEWLPQATLDEIQSNLVAIKGPLTTPIGGGIRSLNVALRKALDLYACQRPTQWFEGVPSPVKHPENVDIVIFRENTEDIYAGIEFEANTADGDSLKQFLTQTLGVRYAFTPSTALGIKIVSEEGSKRLIRAALEHAVQRRRKSVTLVHKGNIMKFTEGAFMQWGYDVAEEEFRDHVFTWREWETIKGEQGPQTANQKQSDAIASGKIIVKDIIADNFLQQILLNPGDFDVVATLNLNGDYISDALAAMVGGIGIAPGANINFNTGHAIFEATHGTAPRFANTDTMNPSSVILSGAMMLDYLGWGEAALLIRTSIQKTILQKTVTIDFYEKMEGATLLKTSEFADQLIQNL